MLKRIACLFAVLLALSATATAQDAKPRGSLSDVSGVWIMLVAGHQIGLELEQKGTVVEGVMLAMGQRILLIGDYVDRKLTLKGEAPADGSPGPPTGPGAHPITARMLDDGTFAGELTTNHGPTKWTGERLQPK